jgi:hypothetical protein
VAATVTPTNDVTFCKPILFTPIVFTNDSVHTCNYTVSWTTSFSGVGTIEYEDPVSPGQSDAVSVFFSTTTVVGDPQFVGLRGQSYQVHGLDGSV